MAVNMSAGYQFQTSIHGAEGTSFVVMKALN